MSAVAETPAKLPTHTDLPCEDGAIVTNFLEHPQSMLLTDVLLPVIRALHPDGRFAIGQDSGIYWKHTDPPLSGCKSPDWYYVPNVPAMLDGEARRSYVLWQEHVRPVLLIEYVSGDGSEEHDRTPGVGKFWIYENEIRAAHYAIYDVFHDTLEVYHLERGRYRKTRANAAGRFPIPPMGIELGLWEGEFCNNVCAWLRVWDDQGQMLPHSTEWIEAFKDQIWGSSDFRVGDL